MNTRLLRKIAKVIQEKPEQFDMRWFDGFGCVTTHCIGGWARKLSHGKDAQEALQITLDQAQRLFYVEGFIDGIGWPKKFWGRRKGNEGIWFPTPKQAAARIEHFIKTGGAE